jgi:hypothetical protein
MTVGISEVARFAASAWTSPLITMTSTFCRAYSAAISPPSDYADGPAILDGDVAAPSSPSRLAKAARFVTSADAVLGPIKPTIGSFAGYRAHTANGQAPSGSCRRKSPRGGTCRESRHRRQADRQLRQNRESRTNTNRASTQGMRPPRHCRSASHRRIPRRHERPFSPWLRECLRTHRAGGRRIDAAPA